LTFGFSQAALRDSSLQARAAVDAIVKSRAVPDDVTILLRVSLYCNSVLEQLTIDHSVESDGLADAIEAINAGAPAVVAIQERLAARSVIDATGAEAQALDGLVDAYEALLATATRRESVAALKRVAQQAGGA
jgi:hypothetical protein